MTSLYINWNPSDTLINIGPLPIKYYSLMFVVAFLGGLQIMKKIFKKENVSEEKLDKFSQLDIRVDKKWNKENISISFYFEILNILSQKISVPPEYGLEYDPEGNIITPNSLVKVNINRFTPIPTFGISLDF